MAEGAAGRLRAAATSPAARKVGLALLALAVLFLWLNMVDRALRGSGQYDDFVAFARDLLLRRENVYATYPAWNTIVKYPPFFALLWAPVAALPTWLGATAWFWLSLACAVLAAVLAVRIAAPSGPLDRGAVAWTLLAVAGVVVSNLETAQVNLAILALEVSGVWLWTRRHDLAGGALVGVGAALKLTPAILLAWWAWKRSWRALAGGILAVGVSWFVALPLALGPDLFATVFGDWLASVSPFVADGVIAEGEQGFRHTNQSLSAALHRTLARVPAGAGREDFFVNVVALDRGVVRWIVAGCVVALGGVLAWLCRTPTGDRRRVGHALEAALLLIATVFVSPVAWVNHTVALLPGFAVAIVLLRTRPDLPGRRALLAATVASALLLATAIAPLLQALSLPFLGAVVLFVALAATLARERQYG